MLLDKEQARRLKLLHLDSRDGFHSVSERADERQERLCYHGEKSEHLFDGAFDELGEGNDGVL